MKELICNGVPMTGCFARILIFYVIMMIIIFEKKFKCKRLSGV